MGGIVDSASPTTADLDEEGTREYIVGFYELPDDRDTYQGEPVIFVDEDLTYFLVETDNPATFTVNVEFDDRVRYYEDNANDFELAYTPDDGRYADQYGPQITNTESAWDTTLGSTAVKVGLLDSGITTDHEDFVADRVSGHDYVNGDGTPEDHNGCGYHGSHTAGTAAATTDNGVGIAGMSESSIIMHKIFDSGFMGCGAAGTSQIAQALKDLGDKGAHVSSNSWGGGSNSTAINDAIDYAHDKGTIHVAAAGNAGSCTDCVGQPWEARPGKVIIVTCSDDNDAFCSFSSQGPETDIIAPGDSVLSVDGGTTTGYIQKSGTSMSTPHVSGAIGLYVAANGDEPYDVVRSDLGSTADDLGMSAERQGDGRLNTGNFVAAGDGDGGGGDTNSPPTAAFTSDCTDTTCTFDASNSTDSDGNIASYDWEFGDGNTATGEVVDHTYAENGTYTVNLTVTDDDGATDTASDDVTVGDSDGGDTNSPPTAAFTSDCTDTTCTFDASNSTDSDGNIASYDWEFGDGNTATGEVVDHTYAENGTYTVNLTVTDDDGATDTASDDVTVGDSGGGGGDTMHVHDIGHRMTGPHVNADVVIYDSSENPVADATVDAETCDSNNNCQTWTATTDSSGVASFKWKHAGSGTYTTCVNDVTHDTLTWDSANDHAADGSCETTTV